MVTQLWKTVPKLIHSASAVHHQLCSQALRQTPSAVWHPLYKPSLTARHLVTSHMIMEQSSLSAAAAPNSSSASGSSGSGSGGCDGSSSGGNVAERWEQDIIRSCEDKRLYRYLKLENNLKILLVSDPTTDKSAASLDVHIGSMSDPWDIPGLAHFCEHLLFLGTEKFPNESDYNKYLSEHSGGSNAFTASDHTNYYFDVAPDSFRSALDRFAQFFLCPLFTESCVEREVKAVHSEHEKNLLNDYWRLGQLQKSTARPGHPYTKFGTGSQETLCTAPAARGVCVRDELLNFHRRWYSANAMTLSLLSKESLDELEAVVVGLFSGVEDKAVEVPCWPEHPLGPEQLRKTALVVPVKDIRNLNITWPLPDMHEHYKTSPGHYLGHLIGHESAGSLLSHLKEQGWVNSLMGGQKSGARGFAFFCVNIDLTEDGIAHTDDIITAVFQYLTLLREAGPQAWVYEEISNLCSTSFRFKDKERPQNYVVGLAESMHYFPPEEVLCGGYLMQHYDAPLITSVLDRLTPDNVMVAIVGRQLSAKATQSEKWYGTKYHFEDIPETTLEQWRNCGLSPAFTLPAPNHFIPAHLELCPTTEAETPATLPEKVLSTPLVEVWYKQDTEYNLPKSVMHAELFSPAAYRDPRNTNLLHMFAQLCRDALTEFSYDAELAGIDYSLNNSKYGITLSVRGYYDKQPVLVQKIMEKLTNFIVDPKRFEILKDTYVRALCNFNADQPHQHAVYYTSLLLSQHAWSKEDLLEAAKDDLDVESLKAFIPVLLAQLHVEVLVHGSVTKQWALALVDQVTAPLLARTPPTTPLLPKQKLRQREVCLPAGRSFRYSAVNDVHASSAVEMVLQCGMQSTTANAVFELIAQILQEPAYDELRTKEQLGYIVWSSLRRINGTLGFRVIVQSPHHPVYLDDRIEAFLYKMKKHIASLSDEDFCRHRDALILLRLEKPKKMGTLSLRWWTEVVCNQYNFDRDNIEVEALRATTKQQLIDYYMRYIAHDGAERAKLSVHVVSTAAGGAGAEGAKSPPTPAENLAPPPPSCTQVEDVACITTFKASLPLFPLMQPYNSAAVAASASATSVASTTTTTTTATTPSIATTSTTSADTVNIGTATIDGSTTNDVTTDGATTDGATTDGATTDDATTDDAKTDAAAAPANL